MQKENFTSVPPDVRSWSTKASKFYLCGKKKDNKGYHRAAC
jgi:hypothetical protein